MRCITSPAPFQCGRSNGTTSTPGKRGFERRDGRRVRAISDAHEERARVEPYRVAALGERRRCELRRDRHARGLEGSFESGRLASPPFLPRPEQHGALLADENRVVHVDGIGIPGLVARDHDFRTRLLEQCAEAFVLRGCRRVVGCGSPSVLAPARGVLRKRRANEHAPERPRHRCASVLRHAADATRCSRASGRRGERPAARRCRARASRGVCSRVALAMCGVRTTLSSVSSSSLHAGSSSNTSSAAPAIVPPGAPRRAPASSTTLPRGRVDEDRRRPHRRERSRHRSSGVSAGVSGAYRGSRRPRSRKLVVEVIVRAGRKLPRAPSPSASSATRLPIRPRPDDEELLAVEALTEHELGRELPRLAPADEAVAFGDAAEERERKADRELRRARS